MGEIELNGTFADLEEYRKKYLQYLPSDGIKWLLIGESPPEQKDGKTPRFFYYDEDGIDIHDSLFKEMMTALFLPDWTETKWVDENQIGREKRNLLRKFSKRGFYLIDISSKSNRLKDLTPQETEDVHQAFSKYVSDLAKQGYITKNTRIAAIGGSPLKALGKLQGSKDGTQLIIHVNDQILSIPIMPEKIIFPSQYLDRIEKFRDGIKSLLTMNEIIEAAITEFCLEFIENPYLCYTEHGLHAMFYRRLVEMLPRDKRYTNAGRKRICTVQKEYRMSDSLDEVKAAHWDIAVIDANQDSGIENWYDKLKLNSVIEFGMNEDIKHLNGDIKRLSDDRSGIKNGFIVHLYRLSDGITKRDWSNRSERIIGKEDIKSEIERHGSNVVAFYAQRDDTKGEGKGPWKIKLNLMPELLKEY